MKLALVFLLVTLVAISQQHYYNDFLQNQDQVPLRNQQWKPSTTRIGEIQEIISFFKVQFILKFQPF